MEKDIQSIMVIGDSISKGVVYSEDKKRYTFLKEGFIKGISNLLHVPVHNLSRFGSTLLTGMDLLAEKFKEINPDIVLIEFGGNDCDFDWDAIANEPGISHLPQTTLEKFEQTLRGIISFLNEKGKTPVLMNLPPLNDKAYFKWFTHENPERADKILSWLRNSNRIYWWQEQYSCLIEHISKVTSTRLINVRSAFLKTEDYTNYICKDGIHPNEKGQLLIKEVLREYISQNAAYLFSAK
ncbi:MAG: SGNH/GDSL hydrolase family protein [Eubacteriales bacterium]